MKKNFFKKLAVSVSTASAAVLAGTATVLADDGGDADWMKSGDGSGGVFSGLMDKVKTIGQDAYSLLVVIGVAVMVVCLIIAGINFALTKNGNKKQENMSWVAYIIAAGFLIGAATTIVGIVMKASSSI